MARGKGASVLLRVAAMAVAVLTSLIIDGETVAAQQSAYLLDLLAGGTGSALGGSPGVPAIAGPRTPLEGEFATNQLQFERVRRARIDTRFGIKQLFRDRGIRYPAAEVFLRIFKRERVLELWVRPGDADTFALLKSYNICALAGELGPKRGQGDGQTPEGFYEIDFFNPQSEFHLSLHLNYPNRSDALLGRRGGLGGDIFIHGGCVTEGCLAVTDESIKELYWIAVEARSGGQRRIPVHIFPARLDAEEMERLAVAFADEPELRRFWRNLRPGYDYFEQNHKLPDIHVNDRGSYRLAGEPEHGPDDPPVADPAQQTSSTSAATSGRGR
ncbi:MAG: L,D-transpeptidase family protein [Longimicrobiales bacterium]